MRPNNPKDYVTAVALLALIVVIGCTIEVNINTDSDDQPTVPIVTAAPEAPPAPKQAPLPPTEPDAAPIPATPIPPPAPEMLPPEESAVRDALFRYRREVAVAPPPPADLAERPQFTPFTQAPSIFNRTEVAEAMRREYPPLLRDAGIGGTVIVYFFIDAEGVVHSTQLNNSSGHPALDDAAMRVAPVYRFLPALNRGEKVPVWVSFPLTFQPN